MAADILLYNADLIPVGEDQKQHLELTRDLAARFNNRFGETFRMPDPYIPEVGGRIMSLDDASKKMSKSNPNKNSFITMLDEPSVIRKKISRAVTDSGREVRFDPVQKSEISNLMSIYTHCSDLTLADLEAKYEGQGYGAFKKDLAEAVVSTFEPIQQRYREIRESGYIFDVLKKGAEKASETAELTLNEVKEKMGYILPL